MRPHANTDSGLPLDGRSSLSSLVAEAGELQLSSQSPRSTGLQSPKRKKRLRPKSAKKEPKSPTPAQGIIDELDAIDTTCSIFGGDFDECPEYVEPATIGKPAVMNGSALRKTDKVAFLGDMFSDGFNEMLSRTAGKSIQETDTDARRTMTDRVLYKASNAIAADKNVTFKFLAVFVCVSALLQAAIWYGLCLWNNDEESAEVFGAESYKDSLFVAFQLIMAAGLEDLPASGESASGNLIRVFFLLQIFSGLVVFAIFVGFITDSVTGFMNELAEGRTKVVANGHTLILGWNEATVRVVCQIAFLRRQYQIMNEVWHRRWFPWRRLPPSTPLAAADIVIVSNRFEKREMDEMLESAMSERGISTKRTKIGSNVICRVGDPTNPHDLVRVAAPNATSILIMMTHRDAEEKEVSKGYIENGATMRTILALRRVLFADQRIIAGGTFHDDFRVVVQLSQPSEYVNSAYFTAPDGRKIVFPVDLSQFLNSLMFSCVTQPGLAKVLMELFNFEKPSIRKRRACDLIGGATQQPGGLVGMRFEELAQEVDNCVIIGIMDRDHPNRAGDGIVPTNNNRIVAPDDLIIFVGLSSMPQPDPSGHELAIAFEETANGARRRASQKVLPEKHILVLGWRQVWTTQKRRFIKRIEDMTANLRSNSSITFVNEVPQETFLDIVTDSFESLNDPHDKTKVNFSHRPGCTIVGRQVIGDPSKLDVLQPLIMEADYDSTIVLGTQANTKLPDASEDMRVLCIMLQLRHLLSLKQSTHPMHVVGENNVDDTADLALPPRAQKCEKNRDADFINTQAIIARTLVQTLANPIINPAVKELFDNAPGLPFVYLAPAEDVVSLNTELPFGAVKHACQHHFLPHTLTICIGYTKNTEEPHVAPNKRQIVRLERGDCLICIMREVTW